MKSGRPISSASAFMSARAFAFAGTGQMLISTNSCFLKSMPYGLDLSCDQANSIGIKPTEHARRIPASTILNTASAFGLTSAEANSISPMSLLPTGPTFLAVPMTFSGDELSCANSAIGFFMNEPSCHPCGSIVSPMRSTEPSENVNRRARVLPSTSVATSSFALSKLSWKSLIWPCASIGPR